MEEQHVAGGNIASSTTDAQQLPRYLSNAQKMRKKSRFVDFLREARRILGGLLLQIPYNQAGVRDARTGRATRMHVTQSGDRYGSS
ncbi:MAG: hypothetical protein EOS25_02190 [Mesorhizobium sp.]|uniref:hypothetical protein n=1 Tax=Mesorhizobium sp. TaxID=1871066 RepID=UPI000FE975B6|nr:hypothetical protein [Mesorhizobium sp.]RWD50791.1 MAG: hypothetical protein EOS59_08135 [Mesorhizobium sp.]RWE58688.1 MAG: hypothetical protein EOS24_16915 [Mesorhizobium sp.]RWF09089.1 MAG: hypothetical protein EOS69_21060 [Mesorhizobium sp.]RWF22348.1 MAG: hypothetical protein EOS25_02190 [Mesorhizobium sp.]